MKRLSHIFFIYVAFFATMGFSAAAAEQEVDRLISEIDELCAKGQQRLYDVACDERVMQIYFQSLQLVDAALEKFPQNYELLWRGARSAALYCEVVNDLRPEGWQQICTTIGNRGLEFGSLAQQVNPGRVEGYFWRTYAIGGYRHGLGTGMAGAMTAIQDGFLNKVREDAEKGYAIDPSYLGFGTTYTYIQFLGNIPGGMYMKGYGFRKSRFEEALKYYDEFIANYPQNSFMQTANQWDVKATCAAAFLLDAVDVLQMTGAMRDKYLGDARWLCELGVNSNRKSFAKRCEEMLQEVKRKEIYGFYAGNS